MLARKIFRSFLKRLKQFGKSEKGMTLPLMAVSMIVITGMVGIAIDTARAQLVQSKLQFSLDAAGLAAGSTASTANLVTEAKKYLNANFNGYLGANLQDVNVNTNSTTTIVTLTATATLPTTFMQVLGQSLITVSANTQITRQIAGLEVTLIIDVSYGDDLANFKAGLDNFIQTLFTSAAGVSDNLYVAVVPFNHTVNIGTNHTSWINPGSQAAINAAYPIGWGASSWGGCVMARPAPYNTQDDPPGTGNTLFNMYYYGSDTAATLSTKTNYVKPGQGQSLTPAQALSAYNLGPSKWQSLNNIQQTNAISTLNFAQYYGVNLWQGIVGVTQQYASPLNTLNQGPNFMCPPAIMPLSNNQSDILNTINSIAEIQGDWLPDQGVEWGWNTISPKWRGYWGSSTYPLDYHTKGWNKALVWVEGYTTGSGYVFLLGNYIDNNIYGAYGYLKDNVLGTTVMSTAINKINSNTTSECNAIKSNGVYVYLLGYSADGSASGLPSFMSGCATAQNYAFWFGPGDWNAFNTALNAIADSLVNLRVSQ